MKFLQVVGLSTVLVAAVPLRLAPDLKVEVLPPTAPVGEVPAIAVQVLPSRFTLTEKASQKVTQQVEVGAGKKGRASLVQKSKKTKQNLTGPQKGVLAQVLQQHNKLRCNHGSGQLTWDSDIARSAQLWADQNKCSLAHSHNENGESIARGVGLNGVAATNAWYTEGKNYNYTAANSDRSSHFTQLIWKSTKSMGCGVAKCGDKQTIVCQYFPGGNNGNYQKNVQAKVVSDRKCTKFLAQKNANPEQTIDINVVYPSLPEADVNAAAGSSQEGAGSDQEGGADVATQEGGAGSGQEGGADGAAQEGGAAGSGQEGGADGAPQESGAGQEVSEGSGQEGGADGAAQENGAAQEQEAKEQLGQQQETAATEQSAADEAAAEGEQAQIDGATNVDEAQQEAAAAQESATDANSEVAADAEQANEAAAANGDQDGAKSAAATAQEAAEEAAADAGVAQEIAQENPDDQEISEAGANTQEVAQQAEADAQEARAGQEGNAGSQQEGGSSQQEGGSSQQEGSSSDGNTSSATWDANNGDSKTAEWNPSTSGSGGNNGIHPVPPDPKASPQGAWVPGFKIIEFPDGKRLNPVRVVAGLPFPKDN